MRRIIEAGLEARRHHGSNTIAAAMKVMAGCAARRKRGAALPVSLTL